MRLVVAAAAAVLLVACRGGDFGPHSNEHPVPISLFTVRAVPTTVYASVPGAIVSLRRADISSRLSGYVRRVDVNAGDAVRAGEPLLQLDLTDATAALQRAEAHLSAAQAIYDDAKANYERAVKLYRPGIVSRSQLDAATRQYHTARSGLAAARTGLNTARADMSYADLRAPFDGIVVERLVDPGDLATPGRPLLVVEDESKLEVHSQVSTTVYAHLRIGEHIPLSVGKTTYTGTLAFAVAAADPQTHTHLIRLVLPPDTGLGSGIYVRVHIPMGVQPEIRIPADTVCVRAGVTGVFVVPPDRRTQFRLIRLGETNAGWTQVQSGLAPGERVVRSPGPNLDNGTLVVARAGARS